MTFFNKIAKYFIVSKTYLLNRKDEQMNRSSITRFEVEIKVHGSRKISKKGCSYHYVLFDGECKMSHRRAGQRMALFDFDQGFGFLIDKNNRWVELSLQIPWDEVEIFLCQNLYS